MVRNIEFKPGKLEVKEQERITSGFAKATAELQAPPYKKSRLNWVSYSRSGELIGALTADMLWDWIYVDELWVDAAYRDKGIGKALLMEAERYASTNQLNGIWLWTQSWQAGDFYSKQGYEEFAQFPDFPEGHSRIGFRKQFNKK